MPSEFSKNLHGLLENRMGPIVGPVNIYDTGCGWIFGNTGVSG